jgi:ribonuclease HI
VRKKLSFQNVRNANPNHLGLKFAIDHSPGVVGRTFRPTNHPADKCRPSIIIEETASATLTAENAHKPTTYFTDASKIKDSQVGIAVVRGFNESYETVYINCIDNKNSVFRGEILAIAAAIRHIRDYREAGEYSIFSDSMSSLQALQNIFSKDVHVIEIQELLRVLQCYGKTIKLHWTPSHIGIDGNERADEAAKIGTEIVSVLPNPPYLKRDAKRDIRDANLEEWQNLWNNSTTGRFTFSIFPKVNEQLKFEKMKNDEARLMRQAASGHFGCKAYLKRFHVLNDDECRFCNAQPENIQHILEKCPRFLITKYKYLWQHGLPHNTFENLQTQHFFTKTNLLSGTADILKKTISKNCEPQVPRGEDRETGQPDSSSLGGL